MWQFGCPEEVRVGWDVSELEAPFLTTMARHCRSRLRAYSSSMLARSRTAYASATILGMLTRSSRYLRRHHHHPLLRCHLRLSFPLRLPPPLVRLESGHRQWPPDHKGVRRDILNVLCSCSIVRPTPVLPKRIKMSRGHGGAANVERH